MFNVEGLPGALVWVSGVELKAIHARSRYASVAAVKVLPAPVAIRTNARGRSLPSEASSPSIASTWQSRRPLLMSGGISANLAGTGFRGPVHAVLLLQYRRLSKADGQPERITRPQPFRDL